MKFSLVSDRANDTAALLATAGEYDALRFPDAVSLEPAPRRVDPDRFAVAAVLAFGDRASGGVELEVGVSPLCAEAVRRYLAPFVSQVTPVVYEARKAARGLHRLVVSDRRVSAGTTPPAAPGAGRDLVLEVAPVDRVNGVQRAVGHTTVITNAGLLRVPGTETTLMGALPLIALAVLYAEDLEADSIEITVEEEVDRAQLGLLRELVASTGLGLDIRSEIPS